MKSIAVLDYDMHCIKPINMKSTKRQDGSHKEILQLQKVDLGEHGHRHEVQSSDQVGHVGYQIDQHEKHN